MKLVQINNYITFNKDNKNNINKETENEDEKN